MSDQQTRTERDALGEIELNADAPRGIYTQRVLSNFPQKNIQNVPLNFLRMYIRAKRAYAKLNQHHGKLTDKISSSIQSACSQLLGLNDDSLRTYFPISQIQSGGGTCTNMNINEIIAHFATEQLASKSDKVRSHDHVNASQSSNDTFPGVARITAITSLSPLLDSLLKVQKEFARLSATYSDIEKVGRTHLQDAVVIKLGDEFGAYARTIQKNISQIQLGVDQLHEVNFGGTATGSLQNISLQMRTDLIEIMQDEFDLSLRAPESYFEANSSSGDIAYLSQQLTHLANDLIKIGNDLRLLGSGPLAGIHEISLPAVQPGSSIMPGKVNPSIVEAVTMICARVVGNDQTIQLLTRQAQLQLQQFMPQITRSVLESIERLQAGLDILGHKCLNGIEANRDRISYLLEHSFAYATDYSEQLGYEVVAELVVRALQTGQPLKQLIQDYQR